MHSKKRLDYLYLSNLSKQRNKIATKSNKDFGGSLIGDGACNSESSKSDIAF